MISYTGEKLEIRGSMSGELSWRNKSHWTKIIVTEEGRNLMGLEDCNKLGIVIWPEEILKLNNKNIDKTNIHFLLIVTVFSSGSNYFPVRDPL